MIILSLDLAWSGPTGWVVYDDSATDHIVSYGEFKPRQRKALTGARRIEYIVRQIHLETLNLLRDHTPDILVYESTDWHQPIIVGNMSLKQRKIRYAQERMNQRCLGRAETAVILAASSEGVNIMSIGAKEAKDEFGATRKDAVARLLAAEFGWRLKFKEGNNSYLVEKLTGDSVSHHVSDALALACVAARRLGLKEKIELTHSE